MTSSGWECRLAGCDHSARGHPSGAVEGDKGKEVMPSFRRVVEYQYEPREIACAAQTLILSWAVLIELQASGAAC